MAAIGEAEACARLAAHGRVSARAVESHEDRVRNARHRPLRYLTNGRFGDVCLRGWVDPSVPRRDCVHCAPQEAGPSPAGSRVAVADRPTFFAELKRRNVLRAGVLYVGAAWAFGQGLSQFSPAIGLPDWATRWFLIAAATGFPFWIAFAWFYEFTPQGLKRESEIAPDDSIARTTGRRLDKWIIAVLVIAVVLLITNQFVLDRGASGRDRKSVV